MWNEPSIPWMAILFISFLTIHLKKRSAFTFSWSGALFHFFILFSLSFLLTAYRFTVPCKVKVITVKVSVQHWHISLRFCLIGCKSTSFLRNKQIFCKKNCDNAYILYNSPHCLRISSRSTSSIRISASAAITSKGICRRGSSLSDLRAGRKWGISCL